MVSTVNLHPYNMDNLRRQMRKEGISPNETTFSVLITAHGNAGDSRRALQLLSELAEYPWVNRSAVVFNSALGACVKVGRCRLTSA